MARYGKRFRSKRGYKKRYGRKYGKMRYRKMGSSKSKLYRQGGNFAAVSGKPSVELKSIDGIVANVFGDTTAATYGVNMNGNTAFAAYAGNIGSGIAPPTTAGTPFTYSGCALVGSNFGIAQPLNLTITGNALSNRIGRKISMRSVKINMVLRPPNSTGFGVAATTVFPTGQNVLFAPIIRILLVYDRQTNGAAVGYGDVLATPGGSGVGNAISGFVGPQSSNNLNNRSRFLTLFDKVYTLGSADIAGKHIQIYKKLNLPVIYGNNTNPTGCYDVSGIQTGGLFVMAVAENQPITALALDAAGVFRVPTAANATVFNSCYAFMPSFRVRFTDA